MGAGPATRREQQATETVKPHLFWLRMQIGESQARTAQACVLTLRQH